MVQLFDSSTEELKSFSVFEELIAKTQLDINLMINDLLHDQTWGRMLISNNFTELKSIYWNPELAVKVFPQYMTGIENLDSVDAIIDFISKSTNDGVVTITKLNNWQLCIDVIPGMVEVWWNKDNKQNLPIAPTNPSLNAQLFVKDDSEDGSVGIVIEKAGFGMNEQDLQKLLKLITTPGLLYSVNFNL